MAGLLEIERSILEEVNVIEDAIAQRLRRNPTLLAQSNATKLRKSHRERLVQQHELKLFKHRYLKRCKLLAHHRTIQRAEVIDELNSINDPDLKFTKFDGLLNDIRAKYPDDLQVQAENIKQQYEMYSGQQMEDSSTTSKSNILSASASGLDTSSLFTEIEEFGKYLDLYSHFERYKACIANDGLSYIEYINMIDTFPTQQIRNMDTYKHYLTNLSNYLKSFIERTHPLSDIHSLIPQNSPTPQSNHKLANELYCEPCHKLFSKATVFEAHLSGKKHIKNSKNSGSEISNLENTIQMMMSFLSKWKESTIANVERRLAMTDREKELERLKLDEDDDVESDTSNEEEDDDDSAFKNLPLDAYGKPIPFWLYKLQGLHKTYVCEICGNVTYKGKSVFVKHFTATKHQYGLKCMGIEDEYMSLFKSIISIEEAQNLWKNISTSKKVKEGDIENAVEVEDDEGNVMSEKDYFDLKRQGLL